MHLSRFQNKEQTFGSFVAPNFLIWTAKAFESTYWRPMDQLRHRIDGYLKISESIESIQFQLMAEHVAEFQYLRPSTFLIKNGSAGFDVDDNKEVDRSRGGDNLLANSDPRSLFETDQKKWAYNRKLPDYLRTAPLPIVGIVLRDYVKSTGVFTSPNMLLVSKECTALSFERSENYKYNLNFSKVDDVSIDLSRFLHLQFSKILTYATLQTEYAKFLFVVKKVDDVEVSCTLDYVKAMTTKEKICPCDTRFTFGIVQVEMFAPSTETKTKPRDLRILETYPKAEASITLRSPSTAIARLLHGNYAV
jgi:hypothetical protein